MKSKMIFGFHAVTARLRHEASSVEEIYVDADRRDPRMRELIRAAEAARVRIIPVDDARLNNIVGTRRHQGVIAKASLLSLARNLDELLDAVDGPPLLLVLDGITDPHNLGACLRVADGVGAHAVIAPKDRAVGLNATAAKVASGAADTVPYITVTNLARTLRELKERGNASPDARSLRCFGQYSYVWHGGKSERVRRIRRLSIRSTSTAVGGCRLKHSIPFDFARLCRAEPSIKRYHCVLCHLAFPDHVQPYSRRHCQYHDARSRCT